jgi:hypothetical protein
MLLPDWCAVPATLPPRRFNNTSQPSRCCASSTCCCEPATRSTEGWPTRSRACAASISAHALPRPQTHTLETGGAADIAWMCFPFRALSLSLCLPLSLSLSLSLSRSLSLCVRLRTLCLSLALFRCAGVTCDSSLTEPHSKTHTHQKHRRSSAGLDYHWLVRARPAGWRRSAAAERRQCPSEAPLPDLDCLDHAVFLEEVRIMTRTAYDLHRNIGESQSLLLFLS